MSKQVTQEEARAFEMLRIAANYIRQHCPQEIIFYDGADCDGMCVAADCESAANELADQITKGI